MSGSTAVRSALRATGKDQQEDQTKGYLSTLMSSFDIPSRHDRRNEGILLPSDEVISVANEKDGHSVSLFFLSFFLLIKKDLIVASLVDSFFFIPAARHHLFHHLFPLTLVLSFSISFNTIIS